MVSWCAESENCCEDLLIFAILTPFCTIKQAYRKIFVTEKRAENRFFPRIKRIIGLFCQALGSLVCFIDFILSMPSEELLEAERLSNGHRILNKQLYSLLPRPAANGIAASRRRGAGGYGLGL